jgi:hypothetical protein
MNKSIQTQFIGCISFWCCSISAYCQNPDSILIANNTHYSVKQNKGIFGLSKPSFGNYATLNVSKVDSPMFKKKTKDSSYSGVEFSGEGSDVDFSKFITVEKKKFYKLLLNATGDTAEAIFAIASVSHEKKQTFLGKMFSKNDEGKDVELDYNRNVPGIIKTGKDSAGWIFFIENFTSGGRVTEYGFPGAASISGGYIKNNKDSFYIRVYSSFSADIVLIDKQGEDVGALAFKQKHPDIWIRNDMNTSYQHAIAVFFAVILSIKDF